VKAIAPPATPPLPPRKVQALTTGGMELIAIASAVIGKARMRATHFLMKTLPRVASEMALHVLAYTRVMNIIGIHPLITAMRA
jgi:hypothetical protein